MIDARFELTRVPIIKRILASRWLQWSLVAAMLPFFVLAILTGLFGTPSGSSNFGIVFVWIVWWALLMLLLVPFAGRLWCAICPIPAPGEWLQRRALVEVRPGAKLFTLGWKWPRALNNIWLQNAAFLAVALFSKVILTSPFVSAIVLALFAMVALAMSLVFERRTFCRYICPVGGFIGLYSQVAPIEVRVKDHALCATHKTKSCYVGNEKGYGCPWLVFPATLDKNTYCGLCTECLKTCELNNIALYARPFGEDLRTNKGRRLDEAFRGLIMLTTAPLYMIVFMGPWATIKEAAYAVGSLNWWLYALAMIGAVLVIVPGIFYACAAFAKRLAYSRTPTRKFFIDYAYVLVPLGLAAWAAFSVSFVLMNMSYAWQVISDPFGWSWNLFGTAEWKWTPYLAGWQGLMQVPILLAGLFGAIGVAFNTAREQRVSQFAALPIIAFCVAFTIAMLWLNL
ncbi:MAG: 4Fe-4S binding protein [Chloroflexi bacterium]|nr:4Fe-4S binding protein [Chloroflexota bacterium]